MDFSELVSALYLHVLGREADADGLADKCERLSSGRTTVDAVVKEFIDSDEYRATSERHLMRGHTQFGELGILLNRLCLRACPDAVVVDVGARGRDRSNSFDLLSRFAWRGVLIEANPALISEIRRDFAGLDIVLVECAVSDYEGEADFHIGINDDVSSLNYENAHAWGDPTATIRVKVRRLSSILEENSIPLEFGVLSIDLEGEDVRVLNDLIGSSEFRPQWIVIEASNNFLTRSLEQIGVDPIVAAHYDIVGQTVANLILERRV